MNNSKTVLVWKNEFPHIEDEMMMIQFPQDCEYAHYSFKIPIEKIKIDRDAVNQWYVYDSKFLKVTCQHVKTKEIIVLTLDEIATIFHDSEDED